MDDSLYDKRDTLILPILYNARRAVELVLKFSINWLHEMKAIAAAYTTNHDIKSHRTHLSDAKVGDLTIRNLVAALAPCVESLASIDEDGQERRYATTRDGVTSLANHATVNIRRIRDSLKSLAITITDLVNRASDLRAERVTKIFTRERPRRDLKDIAAIVGLRRTWTENAFWDKRTSCSRCGLTNRKCSAAISAILASRELAALVGVETDPKYSDDKAVAAMTARAA